MGGGEEAGVSQPERARDRERARERETGEGLPRDTPLISGIKRNIISNTLLKMRSIIKARVLEDANIFHVIGRKTE